MSIKRLADVLEALEKRSLQHGQEYADYLKRRENDSVVSSSDDS